MATGAPTPNPADLLSEEELEKLTAPDKGEEIASAVAPGTDAAPETPNAQEATVEPSTEEAAASDQPAAPSGADLDAHVADAGAVAASSGTVEPPTPSPNTDPAPAAVEPPANSPNPPTPQIPIVPTTPPKLTPPAPEPPVAVTAAAPVTPEVAPGHQFTGQCVKVHIKLKDFDAFDHVFNVSTEPLVDIINRVAKAKLGLDLTVLPGLKLLVHGEEIATNAQAHTVGIEDDCNIDVTYE